MDRIAHCAKIREQIFHRAELPESADPELMAILNHFIFGEVWQDDTLSPRMRELITVAVLVTSQTPDQLRSHIDAAFNAGATAEEIREAIYQCAPYIGFPKTLVGAAQLDEVLKKRGIALPLKEQATVTEDTRLEKGIAAQKAIFGAQTIDTMRNSAPPELAHIQQYLSAYCFGDIYTRDGLDLPSRELLTFCILCTLGGCEGQIRAHVQGNFHVGNDRRTLISALTQCLPYIGFPRTLNALNCVNEITAAQK